MERSLTVWNPIVPHRRVGDYVAQVLDSNKNLQKVLYYGYGGAGDITGSYLSGKSAEEKYVYTHIAASYAYAGEAGFTGCKYEDLVNAGVMPILTTCLLWKSRRRGNFSSKTSVKQSEMEMYRKHRISHCPGITETTFQSMYQKTSPFITRQRELPQRMVR